MTNLHRAQVSLDLGGSRYTLRLTLQALAEIEAGFGVDGLGALGERFSRRALGTADVIRIAGALARGGGAPVSDEELAVRITARDLPALIEAVSQVFLANFAEAAPATPNPR